MRKDVAELRLARSRRTVEEDVDTSRLALEGSAQQALDMVAALP